MQKNAEVKRVLTLYRLSIEAGKEDVETKWILLRWQQKCNGTGRTEGREAYAVLHRNLDPKISSADDLARSMCVSRASVYRYLSKGYKSLELFLESSEMETAI